MDWFLHVGCVDESCRLYGGILWVVGQCLGCPPFLWELRAGLIVFGGMVIGGVCNVGCDVQGMLWWVVHVSCVVEFFAHTGRSYGRVLWVVG